LEYIEDGNLYKYLKSKKVFSEQEAAKCITQILLGLEYLYERKIVHRDIKLKNILVKKLENTDELELKIIDFGLTGYINITKSHPEIGTCGYIAPEFFKC
jgi:serine/threonine protein kinase